MPCRFFGGVDVLAKRISVWSQVKKNALAYLFILPAMVGIFGVVLVPMVQSILISFRRYMVLNITSGNLPWIGLGNYRNVFESSQFWYSLSITLVFTISTVVLTMLLGFVVGLILDQKFWGRGLLALVILLPWVMPRVASSILWRWMFNSQNGVVNLLLAGLGFSEMSQYPWFARPQAAMLAAILLVVWQGFPFIGVSVLAGLKAIPDDIYEAAEIDGASFWTQVWIISIPLLRNLLAILTVISTIWNFKAFDQMFVLTEGGPAGRTEILGIHAWRWAFGRYDYGQGAAISVVMMLLVLLVTVVYLKLLVKEDEA